MIYLFTGDIRSGKTTTIYRAAIHRNDVGGFLTPDSEDGRVLYDLKERIKHPFEVHDYDPNSTIKVGRFIFLKNAFEKGNELIEVHLNDEKIQYIVIDEVGKLELRDEGFHKLVDQLFKKPLNKRLIIVVRSFLFDEVIDKFRLESYEVIHDISQVL